MWQEGSVRGGGVYVLQVESFDSDLVSLDRHIDEVK